MCGIAGLIGIAGDQREWSHRLLVSLRHRGPDDEGIEHPCHGVSLVHARLAIIDITASGHQPMNDQPHSDQKPNWITYNGEIYNFRELQRELADAGWPGRTRSDTEVLLNAYRVWQENCVERFRGMFAFCLVDQARGLAFLSRDRLGIKPLYLFWPKKGGFVFASELRSILALGPELITPRLNAAALESFLAQGAVQGYESIVDGVGMLEPGTTLLVDLATGKPVRRRYYWQLPTASHGNQDFASNNSRTRNEIVERLQGLAREAIQMRLVSDVPLGLFLSGGIDSASVLALASEHNGHPLQTVSLGFATPEIDETGPAADTARTFGATHTSLRITGKDALESLPAVLAAMDQPTVDGMNTFVVSHAARLAGLTVAVSGLGGDELFGGYASFTDVPKAVSLRRHLHWTGIGRFAGMVRRDRMGAKLQAVFERQPDSLTMYLLRRELFLPHERRSLLPDLPAESDETIGIPRSLFADLKKRAEKLDEINRVSFYEIELYMRHMLLRDCDVFSMAAPLEYRVPLLDHQLVEAVFSLPGKWKRADPRPKPLLLDLVGPQLPAAVWQRPKRGFSFPWHSWFCPGGPLAESARDAANDAMLWSRIGIRPKAVLGIWQRFNDGDARISSLQLLAFITLRDFATRHHLQAA